MLRAGRRLFAYISPEYIKDVGTPDLEKRKGAWKEVQNTVNEQAWVVWLPTINAKVPLRNRFGNLEPSVIPHRLIWNIERVFVKTANAQP